MSHGVPGIYRQTDESRVPGVLKGIIGRYSMRDVEQRPKKGERADTNGRYETRSP